LLISIFLRAKHESAPSAQSRRRGLEEEEEEEDFRLDEPNPLPSSGLEEEEKKMGPSEII
jgi:hypothetical protein